jgi:HEAT repeat protein
VRLQRAGGPFAAPLRILFARAWVLARPAADSAPRAAPAPPILMSLFRFALALLAAAAAVAPAAAQLDLPAESAAKPAREKAVDLGTPPRGNVAERASGRRLYDRPQGGTGGLALPDQRAKPAAPAPAAPLAPGAAGAAPAVPGAPTPEAPTAPAAQPLSGEEAAAASAVRFVLEEVAKVREVTSSMLDHGSQTLVRLGPAGRAGALQALTSEHAPTLLLGAKALLGFPDDVSREAVLERVRGRLPTAACTPLVDLVVARDPVRASPSWLAELLAHKQSAVRSAAQRHLALVGPDLPAATLLSPLRAKDIDARLRGVTLLSQLSDSAATGLLLERLVDSSASVGARAVNALALRDDERIPGELLRRALDAPWILREQALALIALVEREDLLFETHLTDVHRARLLDGMTSSEPFVAGACAAALAGIGYRGVAGDATRWFDLDVPHRLVRVVAAQDFAPDLSTLVPSAVRRLALITGVDFGADGPRWMEWWSANAETFRGARARLEFGADSALRLELAVRANLGGSESFTLLGPAFAAPGEAPRAVLGERLFLSEAQSRGAFEELRRLGLLGVERLPGVRGSPSGAGRTLILGVDGRSKSFRFAQARTEPWFDSAVELARSLRTRNAWQSLRDPRGDVSAEEFWRAEAPWWEEQTDEGAKARRLWDMTLARAASAAVGQREGLIDRLEECAEPLPALTRADSHALLELLATEPHLSTRSDMLLRLCLAGFSVDGVLPHGDATAVVDRLLERFGPEAVAQVARTMELAAPDFATAATADPRPFVRAVAASVLAKRGGSEDAPRLLAMLDDASVEVQAAVLLALAERKVETARDPILLRARMGEGEVRLAALRACGRLGGDGALSALIAGLSDTTDSRVPVAAAQGLAELREAGAAPILVSLLSRGPEDASYPYARAGLIALGDSGVEELLRVVRASAHRARREAALMLSEQLVPQAASVLMTLLTEDPTDTRAAEELAILTCTDYRTEASPSAAWWAWWDYVVRDDAQAWLCGALARLQLGSPTPDEVRRGDPAAVKLLFDLCARDEAHLVERARRELSRLAGRDLGRMPPRGRERELWLATLRESLSEAK